KFWRSQDSLPPARTLSIWRQAAHSARCSSSAALSADDSAPVRSSSNLTLVGHDDAIDDLPRFQRQLPPEQPKPYTRKSGGVTPSASTLWISSFNRAITRLLAT